MTTTNRNISTSGSKDIFRNKEYCIEQMRLSRAELRNIRKLLKKIYHKQNLLVLAGMEHGISKRAIGRYMGISDSTIRWRQRQMKYGDGRGVQRRPERGTIGKPRL